MYESLLLGVHLNPFLYMCSQLCVVIIVSQVQGFIYVHFGIEVTLLLVENDCQIVVCLIKLRVQLGSSLVVVCGLVDYSDIKVGISNYLMHLGILRLT